MIPKLPEQPAEAMFPSGAMAPYGRPSQGVNEQQEAGSPKAVAANHNPDGDNPSISDPTSMFGKGEDVRSYGYCPHSDPTPAKVGAPK